MTMMIKDTFHVKQGDMTTAGDASARIKRQLKQLGIPASVVRRVSVGTYEAEINLVIHAYGGTIDFCVDPEKITIRVVDQGPGIPDLEKAMTEGWSTASNEVRNLGFGAGMGLPNIQKYTDHLDIQTEIGKGTTVTIQINVA